MYINRGFLTSYDYTKYRISLASMWFDLATSSGLLVQYTFYCSFQGKCYLVNHNIFLVKK